MTTRSVPAPLVFAPLPESSTPDQMAAAALGVWAALKPAGVIPRGGLVAIKQHFGEVRGRGYLAPVVARAVGDAIRKAGGKPFLTDSNTLYRGRRGNAVDHLALALEHGFSHTALGFPVVIADGLKGESQVTLRPKRLGGRPVFLAGAAYMADAAVVLTHVTGHLAAGLGAAIKNVAMGCAGPGGKLHQHHGAVPVFNARACTACGRCARHCPADAITVRRKARVAPARCIGCGECYAFCPAGAVSFEWKQTNRTLQERMAEYALAFHEAKGGRVLYLNFLTRITKNCDCIGVDEPALPDLGVLGGRDPVAVDQATLDLVRDRFGRDVFREFWPRLDPDIQIRHAEALGLGSSRYRLRRLTA
jgi:hypothetical protein